jgi:hypothetical protein
MIGAGDVPFNISDVLDNGGMATGNWCQQTRQFDDIDSYVRDGTVGGIKVDAAYKDRQIPRGTDLSEVFKPVHEVQVYCFHIYPGSEDIEKYQKVLQTVYQGDAFLESSDKHPSDKGFIVMLIVNNARMVFRKESYEEDFPTMDVNNE